MTSLTLNAQLGRLPYRYLWYRGCNFCSLHSSWLDLFNQFTCCQGKIQSNSILILTSFLHPGSLVRLHAVTISPTTDLRFRNLGSMIRNACPSADRAPVADSEEPGVPSTILLSHTPYQYLVGATDALNNCRVVQYLPKAWKTKVFPFQIRSTLCDVCPSPPRNFVEVSKYVVLPL